MTFSLSSYHDILIEQQHRWGPWVWVSGGVDETSERNAPAYRRSNREGCSSTGAVRPRAGVFVPLRFAPLALAG